jgi:hypothetical protein
LFKIFLFNTSVVGSVSNGIYLRELFKKPKNVNWIIMTRTVDSQKCKNPLDTVSLSPIKCVAGKFFVLLDLFAAFAL